MGGSGGRLGFGGSDTNIKVGISSQNAQASQIEIEINEFLELLLKEYNDRDTEAIQKHLAEIAKALEKDIDTIDGILFGGSVSKSTFIEGLSDVDAFAVINGDISRCSPSEIKKQFFDLLKNRFPNKY